LHKYYTSILTRALVNLTASATATASKVDVVSTARKATTSGHLLIYSRAKSIIFKVLNIDLSAEI